MTDSYPELTNEEKTVFECIVKAPGPISKRSIEESLNLSEYQSRKTIESLLATEKIEMVGRGSATKYIPRIGSKEMITQLQMIVSHLQQHYQ